MRKYTVLRVWVGRVLYAFAGVWAGAALLKTVFGTRVTFVLLPPIDLQHVAPVFSLGVALAFLVTGAVIRRGAHPRVSRGERIIPAGAPHEADALPASPPHLERQRHDAPLVARNE